MLAVSVTGRPERLRPNPDLLDRLSGVAAQATTALQNGHRPDQITHRAMVGASIGRASFPADAATPEELLRVADTTIFEAKRVRRLV